MMDKKHNHITYEKPSVGTSKNNVMDKIMKQMPEQHPMIQNMKIGNCQEVNVRQEVTKLNAGIQFRKQKLGILVLL